MTDRTEHEMETLLRRSLAERAQDVEVTPALYAEVQRRASRGTWLRRGALVLGAATAVVAGVAVLPGLVGDTPQVPDIVDQPEGPSTDAAPADGDGVDEGASGFDLAMAAAGLVWSDGESLLLPDAYGVTRVPLGEGERVTMLAVEADPQTDARWVAATIRADDGAGEVAWVDVEFDMGPERGFRARVPADPNGDGVVVVPGARPGVAWIEGTDLHVVPADATDPAAVRVLPLEGDVPDGLVAQQWVAAADAQVLLATAPDGGAWSLPMDDSDVTNTAPTEPGFPLPDGERALDVLVTPQLAPTLLLEGPLSGIGSALRPAGAGAAPALLPAPFDTSTTLTLSGNGSYAAVLLDTSTGAGASLLLDEAGGFTIDTSWDGTAVPVTAAAPTITTVPTEAPVADPGVRLDLPLVPTLATDGTQLVRRSVDGNVTRYDVYPQGESEAVLGRLAVQPGSRLEDALVAFESTSEGETSIRFRRIVGDGLRDVGDVIVVEGSLSSLLWGPDGRQLVWTTEGGDATLVTLDDQQTIVARRDDLPGIAGRGAEVIDVVFDELMASGGAIGRFHVLVGDGPLGTTEILPFTRSADGQVSIADEPSRAIPGLVVDTQLNVGSSVGPDVGLGIQDESLVLVGGADGDQGGSLPLPTRLTEAPDAWASVRVAVHQGTIVLTSDLGAWEVRWQPGATPTQLPDATRWVPFG